MNLPLFGGRKKRESTIVRDYAKTLEDAKALMNSGEDDRAQILLRRINRWVSEDFDRVSALSPKEKKTLSRILTEAGEKMLVLKDYEYAIKTLEKAKSLDRNNVRAWLDIGRNLLERNVQIPYAVASLKEAVKLAPNNVEANILLGDALRMEGELKSALEAYFRALEVDPENEDVINKILKIEPDNVEVLKKYAELLKKKGNYNELLKVYNRLYSLTKDEKYLEEGLDIDPGNKDLLITKVRFLMDNNELVEANRIIEQLKEDYPDDPTVQMLYEEISGGEKEEVKPIAVDELFGDLGIDEAIGDMSTEGNEAEEVKEETKEEEINKVDAFLEAFKDGNLDKAKEILKGLNPNEFMDLANREISFELAKFMVDNLEIEKGNIILEEMLSHQAYDYAEKILNEILKRNFKDAKALFYKGKLMAAKGNDMGARNFLMMSVKFDSEIKKYIRGDKILKKYENEEWFKKLLS
ncbi:lipopolysaccharide assembly protein LapB [Candidatus Aciduliprofundum boonei]|uniref:TPR repeat-containing protein n=1 Tax=Aciduliprofundum boonei (strain DSM 19572 / T469) TaxID=439481 RepID=D3TBV5_ACIB4|nr:tetratricopeptide repeat protein [Candidatus Aciduliprofundum boonei]ADD08040.1 TPR repeat-containing protein [Aciduliprofundum boonei T469]